jgi:hypothetical protein
MLSERKASKLVIRCDSMLRSIFTYHLCRVMVTSKYRYSLIDSATKSRTSYINDYDLLGHLNIAIVPRRLTNCSNTNITLTILSMLRLKLRD